MNKLLIITALVLLGGLSVFVVVSEKQDAPQEFSLSHPDISKIKLTDHEGQVLTLGSLQGKNVMLNFMFNGCSPVQTLALRRVYLDHKLDRTDKNIVFLSISVATDTDTPEQLKKFAERYGIYSKNWRIAIPSKASLDKLLDTLNAGIPPAEGQIGHLGTIFLLNKDGGLSKRYQGYPVSPSLLFDDINSALSE